MSIIGRRQFIGLLASIPIIRLNSMKEWKYNPHPAQLKFLEEDRISLYGIPYHSNSDVRHNDYLGISRDFK